MLAVPVEDLVFVICTLVGGSLLLVTVLVDDVLGGILDALNIGFDIGGVSLMPLALAFVSMFGVGGLFATQVLGCLAAWNDEKFCKEILGLDGAAGELDQSKLNVDGGAISLGHPVGCSGNRLVLHLVNTMKRLGTRRGIATECIGGGQGGAMLIETV